MSSERKTFLVWWTALLLFIAVAAFVKHNKMRNIHEPQDEVTTPNPAAFTAPKAALAALGQRRPAEPCETQRRPSAKA